MASGSYSNPNGWMFWPDADGMGANELAYRKVTSWCEHAFQRVGDASNTVTLGDAVPKPENDFGVESNGSPRCFNCGSTKHAVSSCTEQLIEELINLSKAMYNFFHQRDPFERFHKSEGWNMTRLRWLEEFVPGEIRGETLRSALGLGDGDPGKDAPWLSNMLVWGYPKGWTGPLDPRRKVEERIVSVNVDSELGELRLFGEGDVEVVDLDCDTASIISATPTLPSRAQSPTPGPPSTMREPAFPIRWAKYETDMFLSERLTIYNGRRLDDDGSDIQGEPKYTLSSTNLSTEADDGMEVARRRMNTTGWYTESDWCWPEEICCDAECDTEAGPLEEPEGYLYPSNHAFVVDTYSDMSESDSD